MYFKIRVRVYMYYIMKYIGFKIGIKILKFKKVIKKDLLQVLFEVIEILGYVF